MDPGVSLVGLQTQHRVTWRLWHGSWGVTCGTPDPTQSHMETVAWILGCHLLDSRPNTESHGDCGMDPGVSLVGLQTQHRVTWRLWHGSWGVTGGTPDPTQSHVETVVWILGCHWWDSRPNTESCGDSGMDPGVSLVGLQTQHRVMWRLWHGSWGVTVGTPDPTQSHMGTGCGSWGVTGGTPDPPQSHVETVAWILGCHCWDSRSNTESHGDSGMDPGVSLLGLQIQHRVTWRQWHGSWGVTVGTPDPTQSHMETVAWILGCHWWDSRPITESHGDSGVDPGVSLVGLQIQHRVTWRQWHGSWDVAGGTPDPSKSHVQIGLNRWYRLWRQVSRPTTESHADRVKQVVQVVEAGLQTHH